MALVLFCPTLAGSFIRWERRLTPLPLKSGNLIPAVSTTWIHWIASLLYSIYKKGWGSKVIPVQAWTWPEVTRRLRLPDFKNQHTKVVRLSALNSGHFYPKEIFLVLISVRGQVESRARVWLEVLCQWHHQNWTSDLPGCSTAPQPIVSLHAPSVTWCEHKCRTSYILLACPHWCLHLIVVRRFEYAGDPESYTSGSVATGRASLAGQVKG